MGGLLCMDDKIRAWVFILAIVVLYIPTVQLATTTVLPRNDTYPMFAKDCYRNGTNESCVQEQQQIQNAYQDTIRQGDTWRFIFAAIISFATVMLVAFIPLHRTIAYGLFIGSVLNILFSLRFTVNKSLVGLGVLVLLFIVSIIYISKQMGTDTKGKSVAKKSKR